MCRIALYLHTDLFYRQRIELDGQAVELEIVDVSDAQRVINTYLQESSVLFVSLLRFNLGRVFVEKVQGDDKFLARFYWVAAKCSLFLPRRH